MSIESLYSEINKRDGEALQKIQNKLNFVYRSNINFFASKAQVILNILYQAKTCGEGRKYSF